LAAEISRPSPFSGSALIETQARELAADGAGLHENRAAIRGTPQVVKDEIRQAEGLI
jgi:hypothetical protein